MQIHQKEAHENTLVTMTIFCHWHLKQLWLNLTY